MTGDDLASVGFDAVPFALEWLCPPAEWLAESARLVVGAPAQTDWFIDPISARPVRTAPVLVGPPPSSDFTWEAHSSSRATPCSMPPASSSTTTTTTGPSSPSR